MKTSIVLLAASLAVSTTAQDPRINCAQCNQLDNILTPCSPAWTGAVKYCQSAPCNFGYPSDPFARCVVSATSAGAGTSPTTPPTTGPGLTVQTSTPGATTVTPPASVTSSVASSALSALSSLTSALSSITSGVSSALQTTTLVPVPPASGYSTTITSGGSTFTSVFMNITSGGATGTKSATNTTIATSESGSGTAAGSATGAATGAATGTANGAATGTGPEQSPSPTSAATASAVIPGMLLKGAMVVVGWLMFL